MKFTTTWSDKYKSIAYEVQNFDLLGNKDAWAFYLYLRLDQFNEDIQTSLWLDPKASGIGNHIMYSYSEAPVICELDWHCGCTFYEKIGGFDGHKRAVKVGCDYQHYWDEGKHYDVGLVAQEARDCIDSLHLLVADIKRWCVYCGVYFLPSGDEQRCLECIEK